MGSTKFQKSLTHPKYRKVTRLNSWPHNTCKWVSFECSIAYQPVQDYSRLITALRPKRLRWVKGESKGPQLHRTPKNNNVVHDYSWWHTILLRILRWAGVISHVPKLKNTLGRALWLDLHPILISLKSGLGLISPLMWKNKHLGTYLQV